MSRVGKFGFQFCQNLQNGNYKKAMELLEKFRDQDYEYVENALNKLFHDDEKRVQYFIPFNDFYYIHWHSKRIFLVFFPDVSSQVIALKKVNFLLRDKNEKACYEILRQFFDVATDQQFVEVLGNPFRKQELKNWIHSVKHPYMLASIFQRIARLDPYLTFYFFEDLCFPNDWFAVPDSVWDLIQVPAGYEFFCTYIRDAPTQSRAFPWICETFLHLLNDFPIDVCQKIIAGIRSSIHNMSSRDSVLNLYYPEQPVELPNFIYNLHHILMYVSLDDSPVLIETYPKYFASIKPGRRTLLYKTPVFPETRKKTERYLSILRQLSLDCKCYLTRITRDCYISDGKVPCSKHADLTFDEWYEQMEIFKKSAKMV